VDDLKKFDGQPFTAKLYAELLKVAGVDVVITVHNHSSAVQELFAKQFDGEFYNLIPSELYADYLKHSDMLSPGDQGENLVLCSPDKGAVPFVNSVHDALGLSKVSRIVMEKERSGERSVHMTISPESDLSLDGIAGKDVIVLDDMVRTGATIVECCRLLRQGNPRRVCFGVTHFLSGGEIRENLNAPCIDEILTLNTIPSILNRDEQGRLRKKIVVLKIERWIARYLLTYLGKGAAIIDTDLYSVDMSSKNPRWRPPTRY
jgi:ribose-phosphate pyrophosphokinase